MVDASCVVAQPHARLASTRAVRERELNQGRQSRLGPQGVAGAGRDDSGGGGAWRLSCLRKSVGEISVASGLGLAVAAAPALKSRADSDAGGECYGNLPAGRCGAAALGAAGYRM